MAIELTGKVEGSVRKHNEATLKAVWDNALLVLPQEQDPEHVIETTPAAAGNECFSDRYPTLIFAHGSSGITPAIREFARFIAQETGWAVVAPDSMQTKDRITYTSPVARSDYEAVHAMRSEELLYCANKLFAEPWALPRKVSLSSLLSPRPNKYRQYYTSHYANNGNTDSATDYTTFYDANNPDRLQSIPPNETKCISNSSRHIRWPSPDRHQGPLPKN